MAGPGARSVDLKGAQTARFCCALIAGIMVWAGLGAWQASNVGVGKVLLEYVMLEGVNDSLEAAEQLRALVAGIKCHVNLMCVGLAQWGGGGYTPVGASCACVRRNVPPPPSHLPTHTHHPAPLGLAA
jgi:hypothetical protein